MYVSFAIYCEGESDFAYLSVLIPKVINHLILKHGTRNVDVPEEPTVRLGRSKRSVEDVAKEACNMQSSFQILFIHADTGGTALAANIASRSSSYCERVFALCQWPKEQCVIISPKHEIEAWVLSDFSAISQSLGYQGSASSLRLPTAPAEIERIRDPKDLLNTAIKLARGRRRKDAATALYPSIAGRQNIDSLRAMSSFSKFEEKLKTALAHIRCCSF